jgi:raffinose/stachyose/melibiose transport system substrate-binding protein
MKIAKYFVVLLVGMAILSACGAKATPAPVATVPPATQPPATQPPATQPPATQPPAEPVTLVYWSMWNESEAQGTVIKDAIADFEAAFPNVKVNVTWNGRDNRKLIVPAFEAGTVIDVWDGGMDVMVGSIAPTYALPLDTYLSQPSVDDAKVSVADSLIPALLNQYPNDGKLMTVPYQPFAVLYFYNKAHFADAKIAAVPTTWTEFIAAAEALKAAGHPPMTTDMDAYTDIIIGYAAERAVGCADFVTTLQDKTGAMWDNPIYLQMAKNIGELSSKGLLLENTAGNLYPAGQQALALGEVTMYLNGTWLPSEVKDTAGADFQWGSFSYPAMEGGAGSIKNVMIGSQGLYITKASTHPQEAFNFIKYLVSKKTQEAFVAQALVPSSRMDVTWTGAIADAEPIVKGAEKGIGWGCDVWNAGDVTSNVTLPVFNDLFLGKLTPEAFITKMKTDQAAFWATQ